MHAVIDIRTFHRCSHGNPWNQSCQATRTHLHDTIHVFTKICTACVPICMNVTYWQVYTHQKIRTHMHTCQHACKQKIFLYESVHTHIHQHTIMQGMCICELEMVGIYVCLHRRTHPKANTRTHTHTHIGTEDFLRGTLAHVHAYGNISSCVQSVIFSYAGRREAYTHRSHSCMFMWTY